MPQKISKQPSSISLLNMKRLTEDQLIFEALSNGKDEYQNKMKKKMEEKEFIGTKSRRKS